MPLAPEQWIAAANRLQRRHPSSAIAVAVVKKFSDDGAGRLAVVVAYYGFFSLFPLLLIFVTVSSWFLADRPDLQARLLDSALAQFPVIGDQIRASIGHIDGSGIALSIGLLAALWGGLGAVQAMQTATNVLWDVRPQSQASFVGARVRSLGVLGALGLGVVATTVSSLVASTLAVPAVGRIALLAATYCVTVVLFLVMFRLLTIGSVGWRDVMPGAMVAAIGWVALQSFGAIILDHQLREASALYGVFGLVIGLLWWMYLQAQVALLGVELNVVLRHGLWPRDLVDDDKPLIGHPGAQVHQRLAQDAREV